MAVRAPAPINITLHSSSRVFEVEYDDGRSFRLPFEFMRVHSPSAEVRGHGPGQGTLQAGKRDVTITEVQPIGHYAVQPLFRTGIRAAFTRGNTCTSWASIKRACGASTSRNWKRQAPAAIRRRRRMSPRPARPVAVIIMDKAATTHFGFSEVDEPEKRGALPACSIRSRRSTT